MSLLPLELYFKIIDACIKRDIQSCRDILNLEPNSTVTTSQLVLLNHCTNNYIIHNAKYHRLRLWKLLLHIRKEPIQIAIGVSRTNQWTLVYVDIHTQYIRTKEEHFIVINERMKRHCEPSKWSQQASGLYLQSTNIKQHQQIPFFDLHSFLVDLYTFTTNNVMSIWLWKRSNTFFKNHVLNHELNSKDNNHGSNQTNSASYVNYHGFRPILDTQQKSLMAWDRTTSSNETGLTDTIMMLNTELFGTML
ncbi:hypothetical protein BD408DRAFT_409811 [Parasitella parasitica]|nr:hypothetical protein BD408DRAFT_409811 [Parasitella parasitica]